MGYVSYEITLIFPDGKPASGAEIIATNENAILPSSRTLYGTTNKDGYYRWQTLATGFNNDTYNFNAKKESEGILYVAYWTDRVSPSDGPYTKEITMRTQFFEELPQFEIPSYAIDGLRMDNQLVILRLMDELNVCINQKLPNASIAVGTKILEGLIKIYLNRIGKWEEKMDKLTLGQLLENPNVSDLKNKGFYDKLKGINFFRRSAVHFKEIDTTIDEARIGNSIITEFLKFLYPNSK